MHVVDDGDSRRYRIEIPNKLDESDLDPFEFRLYAHLKRRAGDTGECFEGTRKIAETCKMSVGQVVKSKQSLLARGLIKITPGDKKTSTPDTMYIVNIWQDNLSYINDRYAASTPVHSTNTPVHEQGQTCSPDEHPCSPSERKKEPSEEVTKKEKTQGGVTRAGSVLPDVPDWIPLELWRSWIKHRKEIKKPVTETQASALVKVLEKFRARGMPPEAVIEQSIANGWQGLFELKEEKSSNETFNGRRQVNTPRSNGTATNQTPANPPANREWATKNRI